MTAVIDASALVAYCLNEAGLDRTKVGEHLRKGAISISLVRTESANAILVAMRRKIIEGDSAKVSLGSMLEISATNIKMMPEDEELFSDAFEMSRDSSMAIYDLLYLSLARKTNSSLLSKDADQVREARRLGIAIEEI